MAAMTVRRPASPKRPPQPSHKAWLWRERPLAWMVALWAMAGVSLVGLFTDWLVPRRGDPAAATAAAPAAMVVDDAMYTGSIVYVPTRGDQCWKRTMDNRNGNLRDIGYRRCEEVVSDLALHTNQAAYRANRFQQVRNSFAERN